MSVCSEQINTVWDDAVVSVPAYVDSVEFAVTASRSQIHRGYIYIFPTELYIYRYIVFKPPNPGLLRACVVLGTVDTRDGFITCK